MERAVPAEYVVRMLCRKNMRRIRLKLPMLMTPCGYLPPCHRHAYVVRRRVAYSAFAFGRQGMKELVRFIYAS